MHPSEEHALVADTVVRRVLDRRGTVVGLSPTVLPGSLEERELLARIDDARWHDARPPRRQEEARRALRRHWRTQRP